MSRPSSDDGRRRRLSPVVVLLSLLGSGAIIGAAVAVPPLLNASEDSTVSIEPVSAVGAAPFAPHGVSGTMAGPTTDSFSTTTAASTAGSAGSGSSGADPESDGHRYIAIRSASGDLVGMFGGSLKAASCDKAQQLSYLGSDGGKARAFVAALNSDPNLKFAGGAVTVATLSAYFATLTPVTVNVTASVVDHGWENGSFTSYRALLPKGTAALIDPYGVYRARCICGNPLTLGTPVTGTVKLKGDARLVDPTRIVTVDPTATINNTFYLVDPRGEVIARPVGTSGAQDTDTGKKLGDPLANVPLPATSPQTAASAPATVAAPATSATPDTSAAPFDPSTPAPTESASATAATGPVGVRFEIGDYEVVAPTCGAGQSAFPPPSSFAAESTTGATGWHAAYTFDSWGGCGTSADPGPKFGITISDYTGSTIVLADAARAAELREESDLENAGVSASDLPGCTTRDSTAIGGFDGQITTYASCGSNSQGYVVFSGTRSSDGAAVVATGYSSNGDSVNTQLGQLLSQGTRSTN